MLSLTYLQHLFIILPLFASSIRIEDIDVPRYHLAGKDLQLNCTYHQTSIEHDPLYSVKWYRGLDHFYEYVPSRNPQLKSFSFTGLNVNLRKSYKSSVVLTDVDEKTSGTFRCEVMGDKPYFETDSASGNMTVVEPPSWGPEIKGVKHKSQVRVDDRIGIQCSVGDSRPPANLTWILNGIRSNVAMERRIQTADSYGRPLIETKLELHLKRNSFNKGTLNIECRAELFNVWQQSHKIVLLDIDRPQPAVIGWWFSSGCRYTSTSPALWVIGFAFLWTFQWII